MTTTTTPTLEFARLRVASNVRAVPERFHGRREITAVRWDNRWVGLFPKPSQGESVHDRDGWRLGGQLPLSHPIVERFGETHLGWFIHDYNVIDSDPLVDCPACNWAHGPIEICSAPQPGSMAHLRQERDEAVRARDAAVEALARFKEQVIEIGGQYAEDNDWCSTYEQVMEDLGLDANTEHSVDVEVTFRTTVKTRARTGDSARSRVRDSSIEFAYDQPLTVDSDYAMDVEQPRNLTVTVI